MSVCLTAGANQVLSESSKIKDLAKHILVLSPSLLHVVPHLDRLQPVSSGTGWQLEDVLCLSKLVQMWKKHLTLYAVSRPYPASVSGHIPIQMKTVAPVRAEFTLIRGPIFGLLSLRQCCFSTDPQLVWTPLTQAQSFNQYFVNSSEGNVTVFRSFQIK